VIRGLVVAMGALAVVLTPADAPAHPHVFVDHSVVVRAGAGGIEGLDVTWAFDPLFSAMIVQSFDADRDGTLSAVEVRAIEEKHFDNIKRFNYFLDIKVNGRTVPVTVRGFRARVPRDRVVYAFTVPVAADGAQGTLEIVVSDPTFYTAFLPDEKSPLAVQASGPFRVECALRRDQTGASPDAVFCTYRRTAR
jgi:ABC-type uncharacterized transport system substrate-binding protein